jgi:4-hydroxy-3-polyprenylbenzoate decarboxylase
LVFSDLHEYIEFLEKKGELLKIRAEVNPELEVAEILRRLVSKGTGKAVLFEHVKGSTIPILGNAFGSKELVSQALGVKDPKEVGEKIGKLLEFEPPRGLIQSLKTIPQLRELAEIGPKRVKSGKVKEIVRFEDASLDELPNLKVWPKDGGRFITFPLVITKNLDSGKINIGVYRMQVFSPRSAAVHWQKHRPSAVAHREAENRQEKMEVAVVIGADPATIFAGVAPVPEGIDEYLFSGLIRGRGVELVKCETLDLEVPANAEIVIEGTVRPDNYVIEGPFGDHTGYYTPREKYPLLDVSAITRRSDAVYLATVVGKPIQEDSFLAEAASAAFFQPLKLLLPEVRDIYLPPEGVFTGMGVVSIKKNYPAQAKKVMFALWGLPQLMFLKFVVVVDDDIDIRNMSEVIWAVATRVDPGRDVLIIPGAVTDSLDHASPLPNVGSKMGIDATRKLPEEGYQREWPEVVSPDEATVRLVDSRWAEYFGSNL